ncbi:phage major capsid protein [Bacillus weihaiensis]|uniref:phage major capsid protein n=1 Tax=Bacillus weihaiensis TaxID=1547283 RepID=UPI002353980D|nr:phage major capsid protein [Bacillus weihaiensis]
MVIKLNNHTDNYEEAKLNYAKVVKNEESTPEQIETAWVAMQDALVNSLTTQITNQVAANTVDQVVLANRGADVMTTEERTFFNEVVKSDGFTDELVLPETIVERIYDDLTTEHPILSVINFQNLGTITLTTITSEYEGAAVWGPIFGDIKGQLDAAFKQENIAQSKLTAFVVLPKDLAKFGPSWVKAYVQAQITETYAVALESAVINGAGPTKYQPIGLIRDLQAAVDPTNGHAKKAVTGTLTLADDGKIIDEFAGIGGVLSVKQNGKPLNVDGKVALIINPTDSWKLRAKFTTRNAQGAFITNVPFDFQIITSLFATAGEVIAFVTDRYDAYRGGGVEVKEYDQTLALEDCNLHIAKTFAFGKPRDNKVAAIYTLDIPQSEPAGA